MILLIILLWCSKPCNHNQTKVGMMTNTIFQLLICWLSILGQTINFFNCTYVKISQIVTTSCICMAYNNLVTSLTISTTACSNKTFDICTCVVKKQLNICCRAPARQHTILDGNRGFPRVHSTQSFTPIYV